MEEPRGECVCFSGHRRLYDPVEKLRNAVESVLSRLFETGVHVCICGGAAGFDLLCGETVLKLTERGAPLRLVMAIPCPEQAKYFSPPDRIRYERLCAAAECVTVSDRYTRWCMQKRNQYMVDHAEYLLCYLRERGGGTYQTRAYAEMKNRQILDL